MRTPCLVALLLLTAQAQAQVDRTGTGGGPLSTETAPNTTVDGVTMPPNRADSPTSRGNIDRRTREDRDMDRVDDSICIGCAPK